MRQTIDYLYAPGPGDGPVQSPPTRARGALAWVAMVSLAEAFVLGAAIVVAALLVGREPSPTPDRAQQVSPLDLPALDVAYGARGEHAMGSTTDPTNADAPKQDE